jgi:hypothetical protein
MTTKAEIKNWLLENGAFLFPATQEQDKEYLAGYVQAGIGDIQGRREAKRKRGAILKQLRSDGWETWSEPESHTGGTSWMEYPFSAARLKSKGVCNRDLGMI